MKRILLVLLAMGWFLCGYAQEIEFETTVHDCGEVYHKAPASYEFVFTNTGTEPLIVETPQRTYACIHASQTVGPILPGKKGCVVVGYDTKRKGKFNKSVTIFSNAVNSSKIVLWIKGTVMEMEEENKGIKIIQKNGKWGMEDNKGESVIPFIYEDLKEVKDRYSYVRISRFEAKKNEKWGVIDMSNKTVIPFEYDQLFYKGEEHATQIRIDKNKKVGLADCITGQIIIPCEYDDVRGWISDYFLAKKSGKWGVIDTKNEVIVPFEYDGSPSGYSESKIIKKEGKWGLVGGGIASGRELIPFEYDNKEDVIKEAFKRVTER